MKVKVKVKFIIFIAALQISAVANAQWFVHDERRLKENKEIITSEIEQLAKNTKAAIALVRIRRAQEAISDALTVVNTLIKDMKMVNDIIKTQKDIVDTVEAAIDALNSPIDVDGDGLTDNEVIDKFKHIKIILKIAAHTDNVFDLYKNVIEQGNTVMDDKGRINLLRSTRNDLIKTRNSLKNHIHNINKEIYFYTLKKKEIIAYKKFFSLD